MSTADKALQGILDNVVNPALYLLVVVAVLVFLWGIFQMIYHSDDSTSRERGSRNILYGVIGFLIIASVYGLIRMIAGTLGVPDPFSGTN